MSQDTYTSLLEFLQRLDREKIPYHLRHSRDDAVMIVAFAPGQYWEIEFLQDGDVAVERFYSGGIDDASVLEELFELWSDPDDVAPDHSAPSSCD